MRSGSSIRKMTVKYGSNVPVPPWEEDIIDGDIDGGNSSESSIKVPRNVLVNYPYSSSKTKVVNYSTVGKFQLFVGGQEIVYSADGMSLIPTNGYVKPAWLVSAKWSGGDGQAGSFTFVYQAAEDREKSFDVEMKSGNTIRNMSVKYGSNVPVPPWDEDIVDGGISGGGGDEASDAQSSITAPSSVMMDFKVDNSYTKTVTYSGSHDVKIFVGGAEIKGELLTQLPTWLVSATCVKTEGKEGKEGSFTFVYKETAGETIPFEIVLRSGKTIRKMNVKYNHNK